MPGPNIDTWEKALNKGVRTKDGEPLGVVQREVDEALVVVTSGMSDLYRVPKDKIDAFDGAELRLSVNLDELAPYRESTK